MLCGSVQCAYCSYDLKSAVEWLKKEISSIKVTNYGGESNYSSVIELIDEAFGEAIK